MQISTGRVVNGRIEFEGMQLPEGEVVAIVRRGEDATFTLSEAEEQELLDAMAEIDQGDFVTLEQLLASLPRSG